MSWVSGAREEAAGIRWLEYGQHIEVGKRSPGKGRDAQGGKGAGREQRPGTRTLGKAKSRSRSNLGGKSKAKV